ncbi:hypothetical protein LCGC14_1163230 [marine sediment metagenome]|uniref:Uncharacterized protein n=1 Tax=marine sediment metagenome TaxID=412755 RepID=A0A0F9LRX4_9ZZZZ
MARKKPSSKKGSRKNILRLERKIRGLDLAIARSKGIISANKRMLREFRKL